MYESKLGKVEAKLGKKNQLLVNLIHSIKFGFNQLKNKIEKQRDRDSSFCSEELREKMGSTQGI